MEKTIINLLKKDKSGKLTITEIVKLSKLSRSKVRIFLAKLEGAGKISMKKIGMAKLYGLTGKK